MGQRIELLSSLAQVMMDEPRLDRRPMLDLLRRELPWLQPSKLDYTPWSHAEKRHPSTGFVVCVGQNKFIYAVHLIRTLRQVLNSTLPMQIAYVGDDDLSAQDRAELKTEGVDIETIDTLGTFDGSRAGLAAGWSMKPFAVLASRFQRVILVDADIVFLQKPDDLFDTEPGLIETGTMFWHDRAIQWLNPPMREWFQTLMTGSPSAMLQKGLMWKSDIYVEMESGVVFLDKGRAGVFMSIAFAAWMNSVGVVDGMKKHVYGDKESYWMAAELSSTPYYFSPNYAGAIGTPANDTAICSTQVAHTDPRGRLFWINASLRHNKKHGPEFANLTHWMPGSQEFPDGRHWVMGNKSVWCYDGQPGPTSLEGTEVEAVLQRELAVAAVADEQYGASHPL
ncbi:MAG: hypothetical protein M1838_005779, partial [Thelocarpon superellum]